MSEIRTEAFMLANGMQVVAVPMSRAGVVHHAVYFAFGSADDPPGQSGINHLIEHLMFNGTAAVPEGEYDTIIGRNGGSANAYTSPDVTAYYATIARDRLETVMELEADRMTGLVFDPANFEAERKVVLEERLQRIDNDPRALFREELRAARWRAHPYGRPVIGWRHEIEALTLTQVESFYRRHYGPRNALLVVAGDISADELRPLAERTFGQIPAGGEPLPPRPAEPPHRALIAVEDADPRVAQLRWSRQYRAPSYFSGTLREAVVLDVLGALLGGSSGRLHRALVVDAKVALAAGAAFGGSSRDGGVFHVYAVAADGIGAAELEAAIDAELGRLVTDGADDTEVARVLYRFSAGEIYARDRVAGIAELVGTTLIKGGSPDGINAYMTIARTVSADDVTAAARALFQDRAVVTGVLRPEPAS